MTRYALGRTLFCHAQESDGGAAQHFLDRRVVVSGAQQLCDVLTASFIFLATADISPHPLAWQYRRCCLRRLISFVILFAERPWLRAISSSMPF